MAREKRRSISLNLAALANPKSQRDFIIQPRVGRVSGLPWVNEPTNQTPTGFYQLCGAGMQPFQGGICFGTQTQGSPESLRGNLGLMDRIPLRVSNRFKLQCRSRSGRLGLAAVVPIRRVFFGVTANFPFTPNFDKSLDEKNRVMVTVLQLGGGIELEF